MIWIIIKWIVIALYILQALVAIAKIGDGSRGDYTNSYALTTVITSALMILYFIYRLH